MSDQAFDARPLVAVPLERIAIAGSYVLLCTALISSRLVGLGRSFWHDEIVTAEFVQSGPRAILSGHYLPNNHELFSLLGWTTSGLADSEVALRLWSVVPFLLGVAVVTAWLHVRVSVLSGVLFLSLATFSPLLVDISRQARGYGLAFLAMGLLTVAALEALRTSETRWLLVAAVAGVVGTWTLPNFVIAFVATSAVLLLDARLRRRTATALAVSFVAIAAFYAPHVDDLLESSRQEYGVAIDGLWVVTAPVDQILIPALIWSEGLAVVPGLVWVPGVIAALVLMASSPLVRDPRTALVLAAPPVATTFALWATDTRIAPRFLSFLLVPLFMLVATGVSSAFTGTRTPGRSVVSVVALVVLGLFAVRAAELVPDVVRLPREAHRDAAHLIEERAEPEARVFVLAHQPDDLAHYLDRPASVVDGDAAKQVCQPVGPAVFVLQPYRVAPVQLPCLHETGVRRYSFRQSTRGDAILVWFLRGA